MTRKSPNNVAGVYTITNSISGKVYVGKSRNINERWTTHRWYLERGDHDNRHLQRSWAKHGPAAFVFAIAEIVTADTIEALEAALCEAEVRELSKHPSYFNLMEVGEPNLIASAETRALLSEQRLKKWADPEYRERLSESHRVKHTDPEFSAKRAAAISAGKKGNPTSIAATKARWAPGGDLREKMGDAQKAAWSDPAYRARQSEARKASHADPEVKARRSAALKAAWARRKAI